jgi:hypothetical protein
MNRLTHSSVWYGALAVLLSVSTVSAARSQQITLSVDPKASLAWWEMNPNLSHLWATTCTEDPAWQPGEGHSVSYAVDYLTRKDASPTKLSDTTKIPLYPRRVVRSLCTPAVTGQITARDTVTWSGARGRIAIESRHLRTGLDFRDAYARKAIYGSDQFREIVFELDSLTNVRRTRGDTLLATALGHLEIRGVRIPISVRAKATREAGALRVQGITHLPAADLVDTFGVSPYALGMSVGLKAWKDLWMGMDVVLRPQTGAP